MAKDERTERIAGTDSADIPPAAEADDTEGQSMGLLLGVNALSSAGQADQRARSKKPADETLTPLSKKWPSMRDEKKA